MKNEIINEILTGKIFSSEEALLKFIQKSGNDFVLKDYYEFKKQVEKLFKIN